MRIRAHETKWKKGKKNNREKQLNQKSVSPKTTTKLTNLYPNKEKREMTHISNIRNESGNIATYSVEIKILSEIATSNYTKNWITQMKWKQF